MPDRIGAAVERAIALLRARQLAWGEFASFRFTDPGLRAGARLDSSPFVTTFVLHALDFVAQPSIEGMRRRALAFLRGEQEPPGVWRYWSSRQGVTIDPDLDDTCCASFALRAWPVAGERLEDNHARILRNRHPSGLFKTWLRAEHAANDVDGAVNANVLLYLGERPETCAARDILARAINEDREAAALWYYVDPLALYYMVSRAHHHGVAGFAACRAAILRKVDARRKGGPHDPLAAALALCTLLNFGAATHAACDAFVEVLLDGQGADGSWPRAAFYAGPEPPAPHSVWFGGEELTTALALEALARIRPQPGVADDV